MLVHQILKSKPVTGVIKIEPGTPVSAAVELLSSKRIGAVIVAKDDGIPDGILSERDIVRDLGRRGSSCLSETVDEMMTRDLVTCTPHDNADAVLTLMTDGRFRHLPVIEDGKMVGLISIGDVVKARLSELSMEKDALEGMIKGF